MKYSIVDKNQSSHLIRFLNELNGKPYFTCPEERFDSLANCLMNYLCFVFGKNEYRITECEMYYMDIDHQDSYVNCRDQQMTAGQLYFNNAGGLDITFGNANFPAWGGILIRGIRNLNTNQYINKITEIVSEVFKSLGNIITEENGIYLRELIPGQIKTEIPVRTTRVGLTKKEPDVDNYYEKPYRYIVELNAAHKFRDKEKIVKKLLGENAISNEEAKNMIGYNVKL